jgi:hypothetical protein
VIAAEHKAKRVTNPVGGVCVFPITRDWHGHWVSVLGARTGLSAPGPVVDGRAAALDESPLSHSYTRCVRLSAFPYIISILC